MMLQSAKPEIVAQQYGRHLIGLLQNTRLWLKRRVVDVEFLDAETARVSVSLDVDIEAGDHSGYVQQILSGELPALLIPTGLRNVTYAGLHAVDFDDRHISILTTEQTKEIIDAVAQLEELSLPWSHLAPQLLDSLRLMILPQEYLERHDLRYSYLAPFQMADHRHPWMRFWTAGTPNLICFDLLGAETPETYHFELTSPPDSIILDTHLRTSDSEPSGRPLGAEECKIHGGLSDRSWRTRRVANLYIRYAGHRPPQKLTSHLRFALWLGLDRQTVLLGPCLTAINSAVVLISNAFLISQMSSFPKPEAQTGPYFQGASFFLALATSYLGYMSVPSQHEVSHWLYRYVRWWIMIAGGTAFIGLVASLVGVPLMLAIRDPEIDSTHVSWAMYLAASATPWVSIFAALTSVAAAFFLCLVYRRGAGRRPIKYLYWNEGGIAGISSDKAVATVTLG